MEGTEWKVWSLGPTEGSKCVGPNSFGGRGADGRKTAPGLASSTDRSDSFPVKRCT